MNTSNMNKEQFQFTRKTYKKLHLKEIVNDENLNKLENKEDKLLLEKCFQYIFQSTDKLKQKKYKNKMFFVLVGYDEISMETKNTPFGLCSVSIDTSDDSYTKLIIFDVFKTIEGMSSNVFLKIFLQKIHDLYEKHFFVHSTSKKQYLIRELIFYIEPSKKTEELSNALTDSKYSSVGKMVSLNKNSNKEYEEFSLPLNVDSLINKKNNKNINSNNKLNNESNSNSPNNMNINDNRENNVNRVNKMEENTPNVEENNSKMNINTSTNMNNSEVKSNNMNKAMSIEESNNTPQRESEKPPSTLETIQDAGLKMNERLTKSIDDGLQSISNFFSQQSSSQSIESEQTESSKQSNQVNTSSEQSEKSNDTLNNMKIKNNPKQNNVLIGGAKKTIKKKLVCKKQTTLRYKKRNSPPYSAKECKNKRKMGNDKTYYDSKKMKNGIYKWVKVNKKSKTKALTKKKNKTLKKKPKHRGLFSVLLR